LDLMMSQVATSGVRFGVDFSFVASTRGIGHGSNMLLAVEEYDSWPSGRFGVNPYEEKLKYAGVILVREGSSAGYYFCSVPKGKCRIVCVCMSCKRLYYKTTMLSHASVCTLEPIISVEEAVDKLKSGNCIVNGMSRVRFIMNAYTEKNFLRRHYVLPKLGNKFKRADITKFFRCLPKLHSYALASEILAFIRPCHKLKHATIGQDKHVYEIVLPGEMMERSGDCGADELWRDSVIGITSSSRSLQWCRYISMVPLPTKPSAIKLRHITVCGKFNYHGSKSAFKPVKSCIL